MKIQAAPSRLRTASVLNFDPGATPFRTHAGFSPIDRSKWIARAPASLIRIFILIASLAGSTGVKADASAVSGSAYGYFSRVNLFGSPTADRGPTPTVTLPAGGSATPITATAPSGSAQHGPALLFTSDRLDVSTQGTPGASWSVTSSVNIQNVGKSGQEVFIASNVASTCSVSGSVVSRSTMITNGTLQTSDGNPDVEGDETIVAIPAKPAPNTIYEGEINSVGDRFRYVFNEQIGNPDGSLTVNAGHQYLLGPTAVGDVIIGQSRVGPFLGITSITRLSSTTVRLQGLGVPGIAHSLQRSADLSSNSFGSPVSISPNAEGFWQYDDTTLSGVTKRFYRLARP